MSTTVYFLPTGDGLIETSYISAHGAATRWQCISDPVGAPDGLSSYIQENDQSDYHYAFFTFDTPAIPSDATDISVAVVCIHGSSAGGGGVLLGFVIGSTPTIYPAALPMAGGGMWTSTTKTWTQNPATSAAWTPTDLNNKSSTNGLIQFGGYLYGGVSDSQQVTSMYLAVTYDAAAASVPSVTTQAVDTIGQTTASGHGTVTSDGGANVTERGVCWNTSGTPTTADDKEESGTGTGSFVASMTGLDADTEYYVRAYAINSEGTSYGSEVTFTSDSPGVPVVTTQAVDTITGTSAIGHGTVTSDGGNTVTERGVCWNTTGSPTTADDKATSGTGVGAYSPDIIGLSPGIFYYVRSYAINSVNTVYGEQVSFTSLASPIQSPAGPEVRPRLIKTMQDFFEVEGGLDAKEITTTATPESGRRKIYPKSDAWYEKDSSGVEKKLGLFTRSTAEATATSLAAGANSSQTFTMAKSFRLLKVDVGNKKCRLRLYATSAARTADLARGFTIPLALGAQHGCIADFYFDQGYAVDPWSCSPVVEGANLDASPSSSIYATITNMDTSTQTIVVTLTYVQIES